MIPSVSLEDERELIDGALFYACEANAELGLAFIAESERSIGALCSYPRLGPVWRVRLAIYVGRARTRPRGWRRNQKSRRAYNGGLKPW